jgi:hypothetical protein
VASPGPLALWRRSHWELSGVRDAEQFFRSIGSLGGTDLFLEGSSQPPAVHSSLRSTESLAPTFRSGRQSGRRPSNGAFPAERMSFSSSRTLPGHMQRQSSEITCSPILAMRPW